jgi:hypothetical protein
MGVVGGREGARPRHPEDRRLALEQVSGRRGGATPSRDGARFTRLIRCWERRRAAPKPTSNMVRSRASSGESREGRLGHHQPQDAGTAGRRGDAGGHPLDRVISSTNMARREWRRGRQAGDQMRGTKRGGMHADRADGEALIGWEHPAGEVLRARIAQAENAVERSGFRGTRRPAA